jgi:hypothetical protein
MCTAIRLGAQRRLAACHSTSCVDPSPRCEQETEALLTNTRKLLKISNDEHSTYMKECRPGGRYCLTQPQADQQLPGMQQFRYAFTSTRAYATVYCETGTAERVCGHRCGCFRRAWKSLDQELLSSTTRYHLLASLPQLCLISSLLML